MVGIVALTFLGLFSFAIGKLGSDLWRHIGYAKKTGLPYVVGRKFRVSIEGL